MDTLRRGEPLSAALNEHVHGCELCQELAQEGGVLRRALTPPDTTGNSTAAPLLAAARSALAQEVGVVATLRSQPTPVRVCLAVGVLFIVAMAAGLSRVRADISEYPPARLLVAVLVLTLAGGAATTEALRPPFRHRSASWRGVLATAIALPFLLAVLPQGHALTAVNLGGTGDDLIPRAAACFRFGVLAALPALALIVAMARVGWGEKGLLAAVAAGLGGVLALELHCPLTSPAHLLTGHAPVALALVLALGVRWSLKRI